MKMIYNGTPVKSLNVHHFEQDTNSATVQPSDLQAGITCFARGQKVTGTGKAFVFATYGGCLSNSIIPIPVAEINTVSIGCAEYPTKMSQPIQELRYLDFSTAKTVATITVDGSDYPIALTAANNMITISCEKTATLEVVFGKDEYI